MQFEQDAVGQGLAVGRTLHEGLDLVPWSGPVQLEGDVPSRRARVLSDHLLDLLESVGVVGDDLFEAALQVGEAVLMGRQDLLGAQVLELQQGLEIVAEGIRGLLGVNRDVGGDARKHVISRNEQPAVFAVEADVPGRVTGVQMVRSDQPGKSMSFPSSKNTSGTAIVTIDFMTIDEGQVGQLLFGHPRLRQQAERGRHQLVAVAVAGLQHHRVGRVQADPSPRCLPHPAG